MTVGSITEQMDSAITMAKVNSNERICCFMGFLLTTGCVGQRIDAQLRSLALLEPRRGADARRQTRPRPDASTLGCVSCRVLLDGTPRRLTRAAVRSHLECSLRAAQTPRALGSCA